MGPPQSEPKVITKKKKYTYKWRDRDCLEVYRRLSRPKIDISKLLSSKLYPNVSTHDKISPKETKTIGLERPRKTTYRTENPQTESKTLKIETGRGEFERISDGYLVGISGDTIAAEVHLANQDLHRNVPGFGLP